MKKILTCKNYPCDSDYFRAIYSRQIDIVNSYLSFVQEDEPSTIDKIECNKCGEEVEEEY